jgi:hypothetical protein
MSDQQQRSSYTYREHSLRPGDRFPDGSWCLHCRAFKDEPAKPACKNPGWHLRVLPTEREIA